MEELLKFRSLIPIEARLPCNAKRYVISAIKTLRTGVHGGHIAVSSRWAIIIAPTQSPSILQQAPYNQWSLSLSRYILCF